MYEYGAGVPSSPDAEAYSVSKAPDYVTVKNEYP